MRDGGLAALAIEVHVIDRLPCGLVYFIGKIDAHLRTCRSIDRYLYVVHLARDLVKRQEFVVQTLQFGLERAFAGVQLDEGFIDILHAAAQALGDCRKLDCVYLVALARLGIGRYG